jgi:hypothetical protein
MHTINRRRLAVLLVAGLAMVIFTAVVISKQMSDRQDFAGSELYQDVMERWGTPIDQPVPSVRAVESGSVFKTLTALPFSSQAVTVAASMNYRRRGLSFFSGFDFTFHGVYRFGNPDDHEIDAVFVFPVDLETNRVLLSDLEFRVGGEPTAIDLRANDDALVWTGRLGPGEELEIEIGYHGRGLDHFVYRLDPDLPVRDFSFDLSIDGGDAFDYPEGVMPAATPVIEGDHVTLSWRFDALESGVPVGAILPSEKSYDDLIRTMVGRSWAPFLLFFAVLHGLAVVRERQLDYTPGLLLSATYAFFFVLLPYLAAYLPFWLAYLMSLIAVGGLILAYLRLQVGAGILRVGAAVVGGSLMLPTIAVIMQGYTGLIYTLEILGLLVCAMWLTTRRAFQPLLAALTATVVLLALAVAGPAAASDEVTGARAELPLDEVLRLYRESAAADEATTPAPPVAAAVDRLHLLGRILDRSLELTLTAGVSVLADEQWVAVPLIRTGPTVHLTRLPDLERATFAMQDDQLILLSRHPGRYTFEVGLLVDAEIDGLERQAHLDVTEAALTQLDLSFDETVFTLSDRELAASGGNITLHPRDDRFEIGWRALDPESGRRAAVQTPPPPAEPVVERAVQDVVCTLEGRCITRYLLDLKVHDERPLEVAVPPNQQVERVYVNGAAVTSPATGDELIVAVHPRRSGEQRGTLELVLVSESGTYRLAGDLEFLAPKVSWPTHELFVTLHLPEVFTYAWTGGSLEPAEASPETTFTHHVPTPGRTLVFHQFLVATTTPAVDIAYAIDLDGRYYRP